MNKNKLFTGITLMLLTIGLSSCSVNSIINIGSSNSPSSSIPVELGEYAGQNITLKEVKNAGDTVCLDPIGDQNILVLPITFKDYPLERLDYNEEEVMKNIEDAFFGKEEDTGWESVTSFYEKSSYHKLHLHGEVAPLYTLDRTLLEFVTNNRVEPTYYALEQGVKNFKENYRGNIKKFDQNNDGYLDAVWLVYMPPYLNAETRDLYLRMEPDLRNAKNMKAAQDVLWAYTYWDIPSNSNHRSPNPNVYSWASYSFLHNEQYYSWSDNKYKVDAHTFIHETGHIMGLDDYYSYDGFDAPLGGLDMMDNNIGDHNSYSKYLYDWVSPKIIKEAGTYHIDSFVETGDCLLVPTSIDSYNNSPFDEYLLIEYYTPTKLNEQDAKHRYENGSINFQQPGVKILHVDSRLCNLKNRYGEMRFDGYTDQVVSSFDTYTTIASNNTPSYSNTKYRLLHLLSAAKNANKSYFFSDRKMKRASDIDLFREKDTLKGFTFNDDHKMNFDISFSNLTSQGVDVTFTAR